MAVNKPCYYRHRARIYWTDKKPDKGDEDCVRYNIWDCPDEDLKDYGAGDKEVDRSLFTDTVTDGRKSKSADGDASPETRGDVSDFSGVSAS